MIPYIEPFPMVHQLNHSVAEHPAGEKSWVSRARMRADHGSVDCQVIVHQNVA